MISKQELVSQNKSSVANDILLCNTVLQYTSDLDGTCIDFQQIIPVKGLEDRLIGRFI